MDKVNLTLSAAPLLGGLGFVSPVKPILSKSGYFLRSCIKAGDKPIGDKVFEPDIATIKSNGVIDDDLTAVRALSSVNKWDDLSSDRVFDFPREQSIGALRAVLALDRCPL